MGTGGGLATVLTVIDLCRGRLPRFNSNPDAGPPQHRIPVKITVVDERDGYCKKRIWMKNTLRRFNPSSPHWIAQVSSL